MDLTHPDLAAHIVPGHDFLGGDAAPSDVGGHGSHVAGIVAALSNNSVGVTGVSWHARIMPVRVLGPQTDSASDIADGIRWATDHGVRVINLSLVSVSPSNAVRKAVNYAYEHGVLVVAAVGNDYEQGTPDVVAETLLRGHQAARVGQIAGLRVQVLAVPVGSEGEVAQALKGHPAVEYAEPDYLFRVDPIMAGW